MLRLFISSTFIDLRDHRTAVREVIRQLGGVDLAMESLGARDERPKEECLRVLRESDGFIGIYAHRYGHVPAGDSVSITEAEYEHAGVAGIKRLIYVLDEDVPWPKKYIDQGRAGELLESFKSTLRARHICKSFTNKDDLAASVAADVARTFAFSVLPRTESPEAGGYLPQSLDEWNRSRTSLYLQSKDVFLVHRLEHSTAADQLYDIAIYLIPHQSNDPRYRRTDLSDVQYAEFFLGKYFGNRVFRVENRGGAIGIVASAYGPFLCTCCVTFVDGTKVMLNRYIDFEMGARASSPEIAMEPSTPPERERRGSSRRR